MTETDYVALADFRATLRQFLAFSEREAKQAGLTPQQHQALLAIKGAEAGKMTIGLLAERLILQPHSTSGLVKRLEELNLIYRIDCAEDQRKMALGLTEQAEKLLSALSSAHLDELRRVGPLLSELMARFHSE
ncbi:MarR family transcriptional regulator [Scandinavium sp.]|uniref:MarR family winged helix-turn-helix transcriptional regulator n=1 Tax=Scandinavium sp. TaxID=2830653 RepID=UPI00289DE7D0|nr:MarR family transcriptional regulator [Scandinavium sp.]